MKIRSVIGIKVYGCITAMAAYTAGVVLAVWWVCDKWLIPKVIVPVVLDLFEPPTGGGDK